MEIKRTKVIAVKDPCPKHPSPFKRRYISRTRAVEVIMSPYYRARIRDKSLKYYVEPKEVVKAMPKSPVIATPELPKKKIKISKPAKKTKARSTAEKSKTGRDRK